MNIVIIIGLVMLSMIMTAELYRTKVICTTQMAYISEMLELILQDKPVSYISEEKDTLYAKILVQIKRIDEIKQGGHAALVKERDGIKQLLAQIAHQLRNPLANMENYLVLLEDDAIDNEERKQYLSAVEASERTISFLVEKFMLSARLESQIIQIHKMMDNLKETVAQAIFKVYKKAENKKIYIDMKEQENTDWMILHDKNWICECVYNLLDNSIKYSDEKQTITVSMSNNEMYTRISVEDNGIGIAPDEENKIFKLYYRGVYTSTFEGFGIGLYITNEIVRKHDGFMRVKRKNRGLVMSIFLPKTGTV